MTLLLLHLESEKDLPKGIESLMKGDEVSVIRNQDGRLGERETYRCESVMISDPYHVSFVRRISPTTIHRFVFDVVDQLLFRNNRELSLRLEHAEDAVYDTERDSTKEQYAKLNSTLIYANA